MKALVFKLHGEPWGETRRGLWCETCSLPSLCEQDVVLSSDRSTFGRLTARVCLDCDTFDWEWAK